MVAITFRTSGAWGSGSGANLTAAQVDGNFYALKQAVEYIEDNPVEGVSVDAISQTGNTLTFHLTNGTTQGPFTLPPAAITFQGDWTPATPYVVGDIVADETGLYIVTYAHTSEATFDAGANSGSGADWYQLILSLAAPVLAGLADVLIASPAPDEVLTYDGTNWINAAPTGGGGGGFEGASISLGTNSTVDCFEKIPFSEVSFASSSDWYTTTGGVLRIAAPEDCICEVGFQISFDAANSTGRTLNFYSAEHYGTVLSNRQPSSQFYSGQVSHSIGASAILRVEAGTDFDIYFASSDFSSVSVTRTATNFWIRKLGAFPSLINPYP